MNKLYDYPDPNDSITIRCIGKYEYIDGYWSKSEERILTKLDALIYDNFRDAKISVLDAGCGEGRLLPRFALLAERVVGVEPDKLRYENAKKYISDSALRDKVSLYCCKTEQLNLYEQSKFNVVVSSHIIQHIPSYTLNHHLEALSECLHDDGLLIINTCHSTQGEDYFVENRINEKNNQFEETQITETEFDKLANQTGVLPIRLFHTSKLIEKISNLGFEIIYKQVFHVDSDTQKQYGDRVDEIINSDDQLSEKNGRDLSLVFIKKKTKSL